MEINQPSSSWKLFLNPTLPNTQRKSFHNPKIHYDLMILFQVFFSIHKNMSKYLRINILEREILGKISTCMELTITANHLRSAAHSISSSIEIIYQIQAHVENIKAFTLLLYKTGELKEGFFVQGLSRIEDISKQLSGWRKYLEKQN